MTTFASKYNKVSASYSFPYPEVPVYIKLADLYKHFGPEGIRSLCPVYQRKRAVWASAGSRYGRKYDC